MSWREWRSWETSAVFCLFVLFLFVYILLKESDEVLHSQKKKEEEKKLQFRPNEEWTKLQKLEVAGGKPVEEHELCGYSLGFFEPSPCPPPSLPPPPPPPPHSFAETDINWGGRHRFWRRTGPVPIGDKAEDAGWKTGERSLLVYQCWHCMHARESDQSQYSAETSVWRDYLSHDLSPAAEGSRRDQEILEEGGGAGPSTMPRRDHE